MLVETRGHHRVRHGQPVDRAGTGRAELEVRARRGTELLGEHAVVAGDDVARGERRVDDEAEVARLEARGVERTLRGDEREVAGADLLATEAALVDVGHLVDPGAERAGALRVVSLYELAELVVRDDPRRHVGACARNRDVRVQIGLHECPPGPS